MAQQSTHTHWTMIPAPTMMSEELTPTEKLVIGKVFGHLNEFGCCTDSNGFIARGINSSKSSIANIISDLVTKGWLARECDFSADGQIVERRLWATSKALGKTDPLTPTKKPAPPMHPQVQGGYSPSGEEGSPTRESKTTASHIQEKEKKWTGNLAEDLDMFDDSLSAEKKESVIPSQVSPSIPVGPAPDYYEQPQEARYVKIPKADGLLSMTRGQELWLVEKTHVDLETIREECQKAYDWSVGKEPKTDYLMFIKNWLLRAKKFGKLTTLVDNGKRALEAGEWNNGDGTYTIVRGAGPQRMEFTVTKKEYFKMIDAQEAAERKALNQAESEVKNE